MDECTQQAAAVSIFPKIQSKRSIPPHNTLTLSIISSCLDTTQILINFIYFLNFKKKNAPKLDHILSKHQHNTQIFLQRKALFFSFLKERVLAFAASKNSHLKIASIITT
jgi:hypothetical protein